MPSEDKAMNRATKIVNDWADGEESLAGEVFSTLETELTKIAQAALKRDSRMGDTIEPGDLIGELFIKLDTDFKRYNRRFDRTEAFLAMVSKVMRQLLMDMGKKGGAKAPRRSQFTSVIRVDQVEAVRASISTHDYYLTLDRLKAQKPDLWRAIDLHYVFGYTLEESVRQLRELNRKLAESDEALERQGKKANSRATFNRRLLGAKQWMEIQLGHVKQTHPRRPRG
jgi:ECF sigma factor